MGCYINPADMSKEEWLCEHGIPLNGPIQPDEDFVPVCLLFNSGFTAAAVCFSKEEVARADRPGDDRPRIWYKVSREAARTVSDLTNWEK